MIGIAVVAINLSEELKSWRSRVADTTDIGWIWPITNTSRKAFSPGYEANRAISALLDLMECDIVVKTDVDCDYTREWWEQVKTRVQDGTALCPLIEYLHEDGTTHTPAGPAGTLAMTAHDWRRIRGYDERMYGHGHEDGDAITRAMDLGIEVIRAYGLVRHLHHETRAGTPSYPYRGRENADIHDKDKYWHIAASEYEPLIGYEGGV